MNPAMTTRDANLPAEYSAGLDRLSLAPLWTALHVLLPQERVTEAVPHRWRWAEMREPLLEAARLVPLDQAERRVLVLRNPGLGGAYAVTATIDKPYSTDRNLMHVSYEGGILEDTWAEPPEHIFQLTRSPEQAKAEAEYLELGFEKGEPVSINGARRDPVALLSQLNQMGGEHGVGRVDLVENRFVGMKSRGVYETPGVTILQAAHRAMESITLDREVMHLRDSLGVKFAESVYYGFWFAPEFKLMRKMIDETQATVSGDVRLKLFRGNAIVVGRRSPNSLYDENVATFEADTVYNQRDAEGFIKLNALRLRLGGGR